MNYFTFNVQKAAAFCLPLCYYLAPIVTELNKNNNYGVLVKKVIIFQEVEKFFNEHNNLYDDDIKEKCYEIFNY